MEENKEHREHREHREHKHKEHIKHEHKHLKQTDTEFIRKVIYFDYLGFDWNDPTIAIKNAIDIGYNVINLAFYLSVNGPFDIALVWGNLTKDKQIDTINYAHARGAKILVSAGGSTDSEVYNMDPVIYAQNVCQWAIANNLDGVDYDLEQILPGFLIPGKTSDQTYEWFKQLNVTSRTILGPDRIISHAPQAPYLSQPGHTGTWAGTLGGYVKVFDDAKNNGGYIDYLNVQFYNQGQPGTEGPYSSYETIYVNGPNDFPYSAINQVATQGPNTEITPIPLNALIYGTYLQSTDGSGFHDPIAIKQFMQTANTNLGWNAGTMLWMWRTEGTVTEPTAQEWFNIVY